MKLKLQFSSVDTIYRIQNALEQFFEQSILDHLNTEFDKLADSFYDLTLQQSVDIQGAVTELQTLSGLSTDVEIQKVVNEVVNTPDKNNHKIIQQIKKQQADQKKNFETQLSKTKSAMTKKLDAATKKEENKIKKAHEFLQKIQKELTNEHALRFYYTFFSGETKTKHNPEQMFAYFRLYVKKYTADHSDIEMCNDN